MMPSWLKRKAIEDDQASSETFHDTFEEHRRSPTPAHSPPVTTRRLKRFKPDQYNRYDRAIRIICKDGVCFDIHNGLLCAFSLLLSEKLRRLDGTVTELELPEADPEVFYYVKEFIYTFDIDASIVTKAIADDALKTSREEEKAAQVQSDSSSASQSMVCDFNPQLDLSTQSTIGANSTEAFTSSVNRDTQSDVASREASIAQASRKRNLMMLTKLYILAASLEVDELVDQLADAFDPSLFDLEEPPIDALNYAYSHAKPVDYICGVLVEATCLHSLRSTTSAEVLAALPKRALVDIIVEMKRLKEDDECL